jgi:hypothetical protein
MIVQEPRRLTAEELLDQQQMIQEKTDLTDFIQQVTNEIDWLQGDIALLQDIIPTIDGMTQVQVRTVVRELAERILRMEQEYLKTFKAMRYLARKTLT